MNSPQLNRRHYDEPPDVNRDCRRKCRPSPVQPNCQRPDIAEDGNVVFVHGLFADGSCWSKVIARLQQKGVNCTSVQNPLTSLHEASAAARRASGAQPGPTGPLVT